jgi:hypothetical protein
MHSPSSAWSHSARLGGRWSRRANCRCLLSRLLRQIHRLELLVQLAFKRRSTWLCIMRWSTNQGFWSTRWLTWSSK